MTDTVLRIYDYLHRHTGICVSALCITTALLAGLVCRTDFNEDISAFLPLGDEYRESMQVYQDVSGASNLLAIFQSKDTTETDADNLVCSMNDYGRFLSETDTLSVIRETTRRTDYDKMTETAGFVFRNIPLFLTEKDYLRFVLRESVAGRLVGAYVPLFGHYIGASRERPAESVYACSI